MTTEIKYFENSSSPNNLELNKYSNNALSINLEKLVRSERKITNLILQYIFEFESRRLYADLGFDSMFTYLTKHLGYSEAAAYRRLQSARLLRQLPETSTKIDTGALNLSQLSQLQKRLKDH